MTEILNSPLILSIVFPMLTAIGTLPLLRWALSGEKSETYASLSITFGCLMAVVCAYGRPELSFGPGRESLLFILSWLGVMSLLMTLFVKINGLRYGLSVFFLLVAGWAFVGAPLGLEAVLSIVGAVVIVLLCLCVMIGRSLWELQYHQDRTSPLLSQVMVLFTVGLLAFWSGNLGEMYMAVGLGSVCLGIVIWSIPKLGFQLQENGYFILATSTGLLTLVLWLLGTLPFVSLIFIILMFFTSRVAKQVVETGPVWVKKLYPVIFIAFSALPALLAIVFFDILRNV